MSGFQGDDGALNGNLSCQNLQVRGELLLRGIPVDTGVIIADEGVPLGNAPNRLINFTGPGVQVTALGLTTAQVTVPGTTYQLTGVPVSGAPHSTANYLGGAVTLLDAGGGILTVLIRPSTVLFWGNSDIGAVADTRFLTPGRSQTGFAPVGDLAPIQLPFTTGALGQSRVRNLFVRHSGVGGNGNPVAYTVMVNGIATAITVTLPTGLGFPQGQDIVNTVLINQADRVSIRAVKALNIASGGIEVEASLEIAQ